MSGGNVLDEDDARRILREARGEGTLGEEHGCLRVGDPQEDAFSGEQGVIDYANSVQKGDWIFIQFGHNDQSKEKGERYTPPEDYKTNLTRFVSDVRKRGANSVLLTPVMRRRFDAQGQFYDTHGVYPDLVRDVATATKTPLIDHHRLSEKVLRALGAEPSRKLFLQLKPDENPHYPKGVEDNTHFNTEGARAMAALVVEALRESKLALTEALL